jgi:hypothetical protein
LIARSASLALFNTTSRQEQGLIGDLVCSASHLRTVRSWLQSRLLHQHDPATGPRQAADIVIALTLVIHRAAR